MPPTLTSGWKAVLAIGGVTLVAGVLRFVDLGRPREKVFDEVYYATDGCWYAGRPYRSCGLEQDIERSWVHPPLGKMMIAVGIGAFGDRPVGWRVGSAVAGTATVALTGALAFALFGSALWAAVGALLAGTEHLLLVQSRVAMLDVFLAMFVVAGFLLLILDRRRVDRDTSEDRPPGAGPGFRPLLMGCGAAFGAAVAVKWSGLTALLGAMILALAWARTRQKAAGARRPIMSALRQEGLALYLALVLVPVVVYAVTWIPWLADRRFDLVQWIGHHGDMLGYHLDLDTVQENGEPIHPYMSRAWSWFLLLRPVAYFWRGNPDCCAEILGIGHPLLFWGALLILPYLALVWRVRRDWIGGAVLVPVLSQFVPWLLVSRPMFLFYMTPVTPFLALGLTFVLRDIAQSSVSRRLSALAVAVVVAVSVGVFAFFWPVLIGATITYQAWGARIWLDGWI